MFLYNKYDKDAPKRIQALIDEANDECRCLVKYMPLYFACKYVELCNAYDAKTHRNDAETDATGYARYCNEKRRDIIDAARSFGLSPIDVEHAISWLPKDYDPKEIRPEVLAGIEQDINEHAELWKKMART